MASNSDGGAGSSSTLSRNFATREYETYKSQFDKPNNDLNTSRRRCDHGLNDLDYYREQLRAVMNQLEVSSQDSASLRNKYAELMSENKQVRDENQRLLKELTEHNGNASEALFMSHTQALSKLEVAQDENARLLKQCEVLGQERSAAQRDIAGLRQQLGKMFKDYAKYREAHQKLQQQFEDAVNVSIKANKEIKKLTDERNATMAEYTLVMSERDTVHKEMEKLSDDLSQALKKIKILDADKKALQEDKRGLNYQLESLRREIASALHERDKVNFVVGNPPELSYAPHFFVQADLDQGMGFLKRLENVLVSAGESALRTYYSTPLQQEILEKAFPEAPPITELQKLVSLVLANSHTSYAQAVPMVPNMVEVGGYHVDPPKALPKDLQDFLDNAKDGVIYFSMGSNLKSKDMSDQKKKMFLDVFRKLKQKVLWKFEEELPNRPGNVLIRSWMPQQDILAHPNIKLFITHGGLLSTTETIYHGVPILAIPVFADQFTNALKAVQFGYGLQIAYNAENFSEKNLNELIEELLNNKRYRENAKRRSKLYHDRPSKPMESVVYWVEYVIRNKGARHLMVNGVNQSWFEYYLLDIMGFLAVIVLVLVYLVKLGCKILCCKTGRAKNVKEKMN